MACKALYNLHLSPSFLSLWVHLFQHSGHLQCSAHRVCLAGFWAHNIFQPQGLLDFLPLLGTFFSQIISWLTPHLHHVLFKYHLLSEAFLDPLLKIQPVLPTFLPLTLPLPIIFLHNIYHFLTYILCIKGKYFCLFCTPACPKSLEQYLAQGSHSDIFEWVYEWIDY